MRASDLRNTSLHAAFSRRCPFTLSPSPRTRQGLLKPNSRIDSHMRCTAASFLRGLRGYWRRRSTGHISIKRSGWATFLFAVDMHDCRNDDVL
jgi:hypothetical protein